MEGEKPNVAAAAVRKTGGDGTGGFRPGSRIQHRVWGMGTVIKAETKGMIPR